MQTEALAQNEHAALSMSRRVEQVNALVQERVSEYLVRHLEIKDVLITVTGVDTDPDLKRAKVRVSVLPTTKRGSALEQLKRFAPEVNRRLFRDLTMYAVPKVTFVIDTLEAEAAKIEDLLDSL